MENKNKYELCNWQDPAEVEFAKDFVLKCIKNSSYTLKSGVFSKAFVDTDTYLINPDSAVSLAKTVSKKIIEIIEKRGDFDKIAFIESADGPVGLIALLTSILEKVNKPSIIIRPKKSLTRDSIKGLLNSGEKVLILNDVATTGDSIFHAAERIWARGGKVPFALVAIDRLQGGKENLMRKGIELFSVLDAEGINQNLGETNKSLPISAPSLKDFGGTSVTFVR